MYLTSFYEDSDPNKKRAVIYETSNGYRADFFGPSGEFLKTKDYNGMSIHQVQEEAETYLKEVKVLNG